MKKGLTLTAALLLLLQLLPVPAEAAELELPGKSTVLMEVSTGTVLYESNAHEKLAPASVTKVMTLLLIMEAVDSGRIGWEDPVTASETAAGKGGSQVYLKVGETMTVRDMVKSIAVSSANDCACAMAEHLAGSEAAFTARMNERAQELGMEDTHFVNCTGLDDGQEAKAHRTSAWDVAVMSRQLLKEHPSVREYTTIWMDTIRNGTFGLNNTNKLVRFYQGCTGLKTGYTSAAGFCLSAAAEREDMELIAVVLGCETSKERFGACKAMLDYGFANYGLFEPEMPETLTVPVVLGKSGQVRAAPGESMRLLLEKGDGSRLTAETELAEQTEAPVSKGSRLGTVTIKAGDRVAAEIPLVAETQVAAITWRELTVRILRQLAMAEEPRKEANGASSGA